MLRLSTLSFLTTPLALTLVALPGDTIPRKVEAGQSLRTSFEISMSMTLESVTQRVNGEEQDVPEQHQESVRSFEIVVMDAVSAAESGVPTALARTYESLSGDVDVTAEAGGESQSQEFVLVSPLEGETVEFTHADDAWTAKAADGSTVADEQLPLLAADITFANLLPHGEVEAGDEWEVPLELLAQLTRPGGELGLRPEEQDDYEWAQEAQPARTGTITAKYAGKVEEEGVEYAAIDLTVDVNSDFDLSEQVQAQIDASGREGPKIDSYTRAVHLEGTGRALWHLAGGRLGSLSLDLELEETTSQELEFAPGGEDTVQIEMIQVQSGTAKFKAVVEAP